jgi:hypothetical protein
MVQIDPGWAGESLGLIYNQFGIIQVLQMSHIPQTNNWSRTLFLAVSYRKLALKHQREKKLSRVNCWSK